MKLPNNMCGIGACVIDSPSKVTLPPRDISKLYLFLSTDPAQDQSAHEGEAGGEEGGPDHSAELHTQPIAHPRLQVRLPALRARHQHQSASHLPLQGRDGQVGEVISSFEFKLLVLRFAMEKFSLESEDLENTFIHLTNFAQVNSQFEWVCVSFDCLFHRDAKLLSLSAI